MPDLVAPPSSTVRVSIPSLVTISHAVAMLGIDKAVDAAKSCIKPEMILVPKLSVKVRSRPAVPVPSGSSVIRNIIPLMASKLVAL